ncbi:MFS transporter permease [Acinetobacter sp. COS3]|jgi:predicted MFS family arabinose efflux permease|uniref:Putative glucarate transporter n=1 Tax=Acinetobacter venetianus TaxID=52133 RepID=A0A137XT74_9GAMM|nr:MULTISPECIES: MFS transporter [Acinetobacter]ERS04239.1 MFS transporter permease [Acinetobacter sp. COS3]KXO76903.1 MFS transporter permease [Acinetobacter venetianus]KXO85631.1 MFS transporter permease [Acinetobacter venetianus]KXZ66715.1 putative glucarate transporter [Acinetobacter venetianus]KXZ74759.1 putative glucarate transporter [Acinetobacter venetianus]
MSNEEKSGFKHWVPAFVLMVCVVLAFFDKISIAVLFADPHFQGAMGIAEDKAKLGWLMTSFLLAYGFSSVFLSFLGDIFNPKKMLFWSVASWGVLMFCMGFTTHYEGMLVLRVLLGLAEGPLFALAYTIVKQTYTDRQQARASTMFLLGTPIGAFLGFPITAAVLAKHDWHTTFFVMAGLTVIALIAIVFGLRNLQLKKTIELDSTSKRINFKGHIQNTKILLQNSSFWLVCIFNIALMTYLWGLNSWVPSYLIQDKGFNLKEFGIYSSFPFIAMLIGEVIGAFLSDKLGRRAVQVFGGLLVAGIFMYVMVLMTEPHLVIAAMSLSAMAWGFGVAAVFALLARVTTADVGATAGGIFNGLGNFASAIAPVLIGYIVMQTNSFNLGITFLAAVAVIGSFFLVPLLKRY